MNDIFVVITGVVATCMGGVVTYLIIAGLKRPKSAITDDRLVECVIKIDSSLAAIAHSQEKIANSQSEFNTSMALLHQNVVRLPKDIEIAVTRAIRKGNGHAHDPL